MPTRQYTVDEHFRALGQRRNGTVTLRDFDQGMVDTIGGVLDPERNAYFLPLEGIEWPPGMPGVPIIWTFPEDVYQQRHRAFISISRDSIDPAQQRVHPLATQYRVPATTATRVEVDPGYTQAHLQGWNKYEVRQNALPYDFNYFITAMTQRRGGLGQRDGLTALELYLAKVFPFYGSLLVKDSLGDTRLYATFRDDEGMQDENGDVGGRMIAVTMTVRVEGELDILDPEVHPAVSQRLTLRSGTR